MESSRSRPVPADRVRADVLARLGFALDGFQLAAMDALDAGRNVLVSAPTGSGKTVVADYAVARALAAGRKSFYTTPLKALSNQKFGELAEAYGREQVGLLTGDVSYRADAPVVVMTTEVLRNMLFARSPQLAGLGLVVLDEVHYLQDPYRGSVWEEVIILAPPEVAFVCLSATVSNAGQLGEWIQSVRGPTQVVTETRRPVKLHNSVAVAEKGTRRVEFVPLVKDGKPHPQALDLDARVARLARRPGGLRHSRLATPRRTEVVEALDDRGMLPVIVFIFSRAACDDAVQQCLADGLRLTGPAERAGIRRRAEDHTEGLPDDELAVLGYGPWVSGLEAGVAAHHAGLIPAFREAVEDCFAAGLLKVVFATETLSLGINMPARTVVIERLTKVRSSGKSGLTSGEYAQLTGRAGRRGLDTAGNAVVLWSPHVVLAEVASLATSPAPDLRSSFRPTYNLAVNLVRRYEADDAHFILDRSFAQYLDRRHHHALSARLDRTLLLLERRGHVDVSEWALRPRGRLLSRIYHESDLLVAEALADGIFDGLDPAALAAVVSGCTFEVRAGRWRPEPRPPRPAAGRLERLAALAERIRDDEEEAHLPRTRSPDSGFAEVAWRWCRGEPLERVLERAELAAGDFVRNAKQLIDLLRQFQLVAPSSSTRIAAAAAADGLARGVVAASVAPPAGVSAEAATVASGPAPLLEMVPPWNGDDGTGGGGRAAPGGGVDDLEGDDGDDSRSAPRRA